MSASSKPLSGEAPPTSVLSVEVTAEHLDSLDHVNHAEYVRMLESARTAFYREVGLPIDGASEPPIGTVVVNLNVNFRAECVAGDRLRITTRGIRRGRTSYVLEHHMTRHDQTPVVDATCTCVVMDLSSRNVLPVPAPLARALPPLKSTKEHRP